VDQIGEEGDAAGGDEDRKLSRRRCPEDGERKADRSKPPSRALDAFVDEAVRMAVAILVVTVMAEFLLGRPGFLIAFVAVRPGVRMRVD